MKIDYQEKLHDIKKVSDLWTGHYIGSSAAMSQITDIIRMNYKIVNDICFLDSRGNTVGSADYGTVKVKTRG